MKPRTKIVCTIGPSTWDPDVIKALVDRGMSVARINASFADADEIKRVTTLIREITDEVAIMLDLKGHKIRISDIGEDRTLKAGEVLVLNTRENEFGDIIVSYENLHLDIKPGAPIYIDDGKVRLKVEKIEGTRIFCVVENNSVLKRLKTVNTPGTKLSFDPLTEKDKKDIKAGIEVGVDFIAGSFIRDVNDVNAIKEMIKGTDIEIIAKIEDPLGVQNFDEILKNVYGIMVARGDLGVEMPFEVIPILQKEFIRRCREVAKPVIVATHMLESMVNNPSATRAEVSDVANAVLDNTDAIMTSAETSTGKYPIEAVETMSKTARVAEEYFLQLYKSRKLNDTFYLDYKLITEFNPEKNDEVAIRAITVVNSVKDAINSIDTGAILMYTRAGFTARIISKIPTNIPIYAYTPDPSKRRHLLMSRGIKPMFIPDNLINRQEMISYMIQDALEKHLIKRGDNVIVIISSYSSFGEKDSSAFEIRKII
ncbi:MAG: pyruvate kinase [Candidatus Dojkabacteria bacterium]|nr:pyruvate kinase [Candidatus Dojkabacteria bacterium]